MTRRKYRGIDKDPGWINRAIRDLQAQINRLSAAKRLEASSVAGGVVTIREILTAPNSTGRWVNDEQFVATGPGQIVWLLEHVPIDGTLRIDWGSVPQPPTEWTHNGSGQITIPDPSNLIAAADVFTAYYEWDAASVVVPRPSQNPVLDVKDSDSAASSSAVTSLVVPIPTPAAGDTILLATGRSTAPAGWDMVADAVTGSSHLRIYQRTATGFETSVTLTGPAAVMAGIVVVLDGSAVVDETTDAQDPKTSTSYLCPAVTDGAPISFAIFDGPGDPPDEHITGADTTMLENLNVNSGRYGLAAATGRATFTSTTGDPTSIWLGVTIGVVQ